MEQFGVDLNDEIVRKYGIGKIFQPQSDEDRTVSMASLDFHRQGELCVTSRSNGVISVINCASGFISKTIFSKRYGVDCLKFTHHPDCIIFSSSNDINDHRIRYHSLFDNTFLRYYNGHTARVTSLAMHPTADEFLSASMDGTLQLWDLRKSDAIAMLQLNHYPITSTVCAVYDREGVVFAVYTDDHIIRLYDARNYQEGPFAKFSLYDTTITSRVEPYLLKQRLISMHESQGKLHAIGMEFSSDGNRLLVQTNRGLVLQLDAFEGHCTHIFTSVHNVTENNTTTVPTNEFDGTLAACYSPCGQYIATGGNGNHWGMHIYKTSTGELIHTVPRAHEQPIISVAWNPQRHLIASIGGDSTVLYITGAL